MEEAYRVDQRRFKRFWRKMQGTDSPVYDAFLSGQYDGRRGEYRNHYPKGRRRSEYDRGISLCDQNVVEH